MSDVQERPSRSKQVPSLRIGFVIGWNEFRRSVRQARENDLFGVIAVLVSIFILIGVPVLFSIARTIGEMLDAGDSAPVFTIVAAVCGLWVFIGILTAAEALGAGGKPDYDTCELVIRPPKDVALGLLIHEGIWVTCLVSLAAIIGFVGLSLGIGSWIPLIGGIVGVSAIVITALLIGFVTGFILRGVVKKSSLLTRWKSVIGTGFGIGLLVLIFSGWFVPVMIDVGTYLVDSPLGWFGHLTLSTTSAANPSIIQATGALAVTMLISVSGLLFLGQAAEFGWYTESVSKDRSARRSTSGFPTLIRRIDTFLVGLGIHRITSAVAMTAVIRAVRAPLQLLYLAVPLALLIPVIDEVLHSGAVPEYTIWIVLLYCGWTAGAVFPLNVIGNQSPIIPTLLTSRTKPSHIVQGNIVAGSLLVIIPGMVLTGIAAHLAGYAVTRTIGFVALAPIIILMGAMIAAGCGAIFPRLSEIHGSTQNYPPSIWAFACFSTIISIAVLSVSMLLDNQIVLLVQYVLTEHFPHIIEITTRRLEIWSMIALGIFVVSAPFSYWIALRKVATHRIE